MELTVQEAYLGVAQSPDRMECMDEAELGEDVSLPSARESWRLDFRARPHESPKRVDLSWGL